MNWKRIDQRKYNNLVFNYYNEHINNNKIPDNNRQVVDFYIKCITKAYY